jgi:hypothetical protein
VRLLGQPSDPDLQKATYSDYYGGCVLKGGVGMCPFGWVIPALHRRHRRYCLDQAEIFRKQMELAEADGGPPATNITDKGMRCSEVALEYGAPPLPIPQLSKGRVSKL